MITWLSNALIGTSLLMLLVLAVRRPVAHAFGAGWAYALWLLPALRLILPPLPWEQSLPLPNASLTAAIVDQARDAPLPAAGVPWVLLFWAGGAAAFLLWQWRSYRAFLAKLHAAKRPSEPPIYNGIRVIESEAVDGPLAVGLVDRLIVVPPLFAWRYSEAEKRLALEHELIHHRRGDIWWNVAALLVLAANWFNPIAYLAFRAFRADQELACDAEVARRAPSERHEYARALIKSASRPGLIAACPLNRADLLKRRLKMMKDHRATPLRSFCGATALTILMVAGLGATNSAAFAQETKKVERVIKKIDKDGNVTTLRDGDFAEIERKCDGEKVESNIEAGGDKKHVTRVVICGNGAKMDRAALNQKLAEALEKAKEGLGRDEEMSAERRAEILAKLQAEIDRVRSRQ